VDCGVEFVHQVLVPERKRLSIRTDKPGPMDDDADDETLESLREQVENPMWRLFAEYGEGQRRWFVLGLVTSTTARALALVPPVVLGWPSTRCSTATSPSRYP